MSPVTPYWYSTFGQLRHSPSSANTGEENKHWGGERYCGTVVANIHCTVVVVTKIRRKDHHYTFASPSGSRGTLSAMFANKLILCNLEMHNVLCNLEMHNVQLPRHNKIVTGSMIGAKRSERSKHRIDVDLTRF